MSRIPDDIIWSAHEIIFEYLMADDRFSEVERYATKPIWINLHISRSDHSQSSDEGYRHGFDPTKFVGCTYRGCIMHVRYGMSDVGILWVGISAGEGKYQSYGVLVDIANPHWLEMGLGTLLRSIDHRVFCDTDAGGEIAVAEADIFEDVQNSC